MMKKQKNRLRKTLALVFSAVLLVAITVGATVAYLTSTDEVKNTFTVGNVQIALDEADVNAEGKPIKTVNEAETVVDLKDADRVKANDYHLVPGRDVIKDPTVHVKANSEPCYVRVLVTVANWTNVEKTYVVSNNTEVAPFDQLFNGRGTPDATNPGWSIVDSDIDTTKNTCTFELRYMKLNDENAEIDAIVPKNDSVQNLKPVFTGFNVPGTFTNDQISDLNGMKIDVVAEAIQAEGFDDADAAWDAWPNT